MGALPGGQQYTASALSQGEGKSLEGFEQWSDMIWLIFNKITPAFKLKID